MHSPKLGSLSPRRRRHRTHNLETPLNNLPPQEALQIIRAFGFFRTLPTSLKRYRAGDADHDVVTGIHLTINGIAAGLRNNG
jgi:phosphoenolpyruvate carboxylase